MYRGNVRRDRQFVLLARLSGCPLPFRRFCKKDTPPAPQSPQFVAQRVQSALFGGRVF